MSAPRKVVLSLLLLTLAYAVYGMFYNNFYTSIRLRRVEKALQAQAAGAPVEVGVIWGPSGGDAFLTGAELAADDINRQGGLLFADQKRRPLDLRPLQLSRASRDDESRIAALAEPLETVAMIGECTEAQASQGTVVAEANGVAFLAAGWSHRGQAGLPYFQYSLEVKPGLQPYCRAAAQQAPRLANVSREPVRVGVFYAAPASLGEDVSGGLLEEIRTQNELVKVKQALRSAISEGRLRSDLPLVTVGEFAYLQSNVTGDPSGIRDFIETCFSQSDLDAGLSVGESLEKSGLPDQMIEVVFTEPFEPDVVDQDYRPLVATTGAERCDLLVLMAGLPRSAELIRTLRRMQVKAPILSFDSRNSESLKDLLGADAEGLIMMSIDNPLSEEASYLDFRRRFREMAGAKGRHDIEPGETGLLGYQAMAMVGQGVVANNGSVPLEIITTLKYAKQPWTSAGYNLSFDSAGRALGRTIYFTEVRQGQLVARAAVPAKVRGRG